MGAASVDIDVSHNAAFAADATHAFHFTEDAHTRTIIPTTVSNGMITALTSTITGLSNITSHDVGLFLVVSGSTLSTDDSSALGYKIVSVVDSATVAYSAASDQAFRAHPITRSVCKRVHG